MTIEGHPLRVLIAVEITHASPEQTLAHLDVLRKLSPDLPIYGMAVTEEPTVLLAEPGDPPEDPAPTAWSQGKPGVATRAYQMLREAGGKGDARKVVEHAAYQGGYITREEMYKLLGWKPSRSAKGITRKTNEIRRQLIDEGALPEGAPLIIQPEVEERRDRIQRNDGYRIPTEICDAVMDYDEDPDDY